MDTSTRGVPDPPSAVLEAGVRVDHFQVMRLLGRGGMGEVYLARDTVLGRKVALKFLRVAELAAGTSKPILAEAQAIARFSHPHIVGVYSFGEHQGRPYAALEYVDGPNLRERLREEKPTVAEALRIARDIALALAEAHAHQVLHRDLKPENVLLARDGRLRVVDFGLAKLVGPEASQASSMARAGTPFYMAPEQWLMGAITEATDVWALGLMLHELAGGRHPFAGLSIEEVGERVLSGRPVPPPAAAGVTTEIIELVAACLERAPDKRPRAADVAATLERLVSGSQRPAGEAPFRGLLTFTERDAALFFGRDLEVAAFVEQLREHPLIAVVGPSGAGKSSFVRAGVVPRLREQGAWLILTLRPGDRPLRALAQALASAERETPPGASGAAAADGPTLRERPSVTATAAAEPEPPLVDALRRAPGALGLELRKLAGARGARVLLFVDQLEELYTLGADAEARALFLAAMVNAADDALDPVRVCFTVRDDFFARVGEDGGRAALARVIVLRSPSREALRDILVKPLATVGHAYDDPTLVDEMIAAIAGEPAGLPLLQFAVRLLWERRDSERRLLLRSAYDAMGGVGGALADHADGVLDGLIPEDVPLARELLLRLVTPEGTRRILARARLLAGLNERAAPVLDRLIDARLLASARARGGEVEIELAHESLVQRWRQLARWIEEGVEELAFLAEVGQAAELWQRRGRREEEVWGGEALHQAERSLARVRGALPEGAAAFLAAGHRRESRDRRRRRTLQAAGVASLIAVAIASMWVAASLGKQRDAALGQRAQAEREAARAALARGDLLAARASLRASLELEDSLVARALVARLAAQPTLWTRQFLEPPRAAGFSPDGRTLAVGSREGHVYTVDTSTAAVRQIATLQPPLHDAVIFDRSGEWVIAGDGYGKITMIRVASGEQRVLGHLTTIIKALQLSPDGRQLAACDDSGEVALFDVEQGGVRSLGKHTGASHAVAFSPDGALVASGGHDRTIRLFHTADGASAGVWPQEEQVTALSFHPARPVLVSGGGDGALRVLRLPDGHVERVLHRHEGTVWHVRFRADGMLASSGGSRVVVEDPLTNDEPRVFPDLGGRFILAWSPDGRRLAALRRDELHLIDPAVAEPPPSRTFRRSGAPIYGGGQFTPDGRTVVSSDGTSVLLWDVASGKVRRELAGEGGQIWSTQLSRDGSLIAVGAQDTVVRVWDVAGGVPLHDLRGAPAWPLSCTFDPGGARLAIGRTNGVVEIWDVARGGELRRFQAHASAAEPRFSPDGQRLATVSESDPNVRIWDAASGAPLAVLDAGEPRGVFSAAFAADGKLATIGYSSSLLVWDPAAGKPSARWKLNEHVMGLTFDGPGGRLAAGDGPGVTVWNLSDGSMRRFTGQRSYITGIGFSPDGRIVAATSFDATLRLWDATTGRPLWRTVGLFRSGDEACTHRGWEPPAEVAAWRGAVAAARRAADGPGGRVCLLTVDGQLEAWDTAGDRKLFAAPAADATTLAAVRDGCVAIAGKRALLFTEDGAPRTLGEDVDALAAGAEGLVIATKDSLDRFSVDGGARARLPFTGGATAVATLPDGVAVGRAGGSVEIVRDDGTRRALALGDAPLAEVTRLGAGPAGTLAAGFADGSIGLWAVSTGAELIRYKLHGPVQELAVSPTRLTAASELGDLYSADLAVFAKQRCALLREVWRDAPIGLADGIIESRPPPAEHPCFNGR